MPSLFVGMDLSRNATAADALSALPNAPVVEHVDTVSGSRRKREWVAGALRHLADRLAPQRSMSSPRAAIR